MKGFRSNNYIFRQTAMGQAFAKMAEGMGVSGTVPTVREPILHGLLRDQKDKHNVRPSRHVVLNVSGKTSGAFGKEPEHVG